MRSPFLQMGGDTQFSMLYNNNFDYDCSWPTRFISTLSDLIILTKLYWAGRLVTWMQKLVFILTPWTSNLFRLNHSTILFSNKQDSVYILWRVFASKIKMQIPIINFFWLRIVRFHLVPPAAILDSWFNLCSIWKVSCIFRHKT